MTPAAGGDAPTAAGLAAEALLGALLWDPRRVRDVADWLEADDFLRPGHGAVYATLVGMLADGRPVDLVAVLKSLQRGDHHDLPVGRTGSGPLSGPGLHRFISVTPATPRTEGQGEPARSEHLRYARIVLEDSIRRQVQAVGTRIGQYARHVADHQSDDAAEVIAPVLAEVEQRLHDLTGRLGAAGASRSSIAAALNPASRASLAPTPGAPNEPSAEHRRPAVDAEQLRRAEYQLIGACLVSTEVRHLVEGQLRGSDFTTPEIAATWEAITALRRRGEPVDFVLVAHQVEQQGALPGVGQGLPPDQLHALATRFNLATGYWSLERVVRAAFTRILHQANDQLQDLAADRTRSGADLLRGAEHVIEHVTTATRRLTFGSPAGPATPTSPTEHEMPAQGAAREGPGSAPTDVRALTDPERAQLADRLSREPQRLVPSRALAALQDLGLTARDSQERWHVTALGRQVAAEQHVVRRPSHTAATAAAAALTPPAATIPGGPVRRLTGPSPAGAALTTLTPPRGQAPAARQPCQPDAPAPPRPPTPSPAHTTRRPVT